MLLGTPAPLARSRARWETSAQLKGGGIVMQGGGTIPPGIVHYLLRQSGFRQLHSQAGFKMGIPIRIASFEFPSLVGLWLGSHNPSHNRRSADDPAQRLSYALPNSSHIVPENRRCLHRSLLASVGPSILGSARTARTSPVEEHNR